MKSRIIFLFSVMCLLWAVMLLRAAQLQLLPDSRLKSLQARQFQTVVEVQSRRGAILDRKGRDLAISLSAYSLFVDPSMLQKPVTLARRLARELGLPYKPLRNKLRAKDRKFSWIARRLNKEQADRIKSWGVHGLGFVDEYQRIYPNESLLSQTLGMVGSDGHGLEGLELQFDKLLAGHERKITVRRDARGRPLMGGSIVGGDAYDGEDLKLTVDAEIQHVLEIELGRAQIEFDADAAYGVVLDAETSAIVAMASAPTFNANQTTQAPISLRRNRTIADAYEPGSTMKAFTVASALEKEIIAPNTKYNTEGGRFKIGRRTIRESEANHKWGQLSVSEILAVSSNIGTTKIAFDLGPQSLRETLKSFGFGEKLGVDLPGESRGVLQDLPWHEHLLSNISFGHGLAVTPLQIANAYAAIANGGTLRRPFIVQESGVQDIRRVMTPENSTSLKLLLAGVTSEGGTGVNAKVDGFSVAGKTGTAQKVNPDGRGYLQGGYISSFAGFIPVNNPKFVIYVAVDHPKKSAFYGSQVAAPIFSNVASYAVRSVGLQPTLLSERNLIPHLSRKGLESKVSAAETSQKVGQDITPNLNKLTLREVIQSLNGSNIDLRIRGEGVVSRTYPAAGDPLGDDRAITVYLDNSAQTQ